MDRRSWTARARGRLATASMLVVVALAAAGLASTAGVGSQRTDPGSVAFPTGGPQIETVPASLSADPPTTANCEAALGLACYSPRQLRVAYKLRPLYQRGLTGRGRTIALVDSFGSPTIRADLATFDAAFGLAPPPRFTIIQPAGRVPAYRTADAQMVDWAAETTLDVEYAHAMAPGADLLLVETPVAETIGVHGFPQIVRAENYVVDHRLADVISQSFGTAEISFPSKRSLLGLRRALVNADRHHVSVLAASGDSGATYDSNAAETTWYTRRAVGWPASDPLVTAVGGTQLHLDAAGRQVAAPDVWNDTALLGAPAAGAGGSSSVFGRPSYQRGTAGISGTGREVPDISLSAAVDGGAVVYVSFPGSGGPGFEVIGGTSEATPLFAGVVAIADQAAGRDLGLLNPELYRLARAKAPGIVDVRHGDNTVAFDQNGTEYTVTGFSARPGYDRASGLGTIDAAELVPELAAASAPSG